MSDEDDFPVSTKDVSSKGTRRFSASLEDHPTIKAMSKVFEQNPGLKAMAAAAKSFEQSPGLKAMAAAARSFEQSPGLKAMAAAARSFEQSPALKAMAEAARAFEQSPTMKAMAAGALAFDQSPAMKSMATAARAFEANPAMLELAKAVKAWESHPTIKALVSSAQSLNAHPKIRALAESDFALEKWGISKALTLDAVLDELSIRTVEPLELEPVAPSPPQSLGKVESSLVMADSFTGEILNTSPPKQSLAGVPTWLLLLWMWLALPALYVIVNWEDARAGLADINARLPQTESFAEVRKFIRTELAGKPGDFRLVTGADVRLRVGPGMKSEVILHLPKDSVVVVLGKEDRTWLFVSYEHQGYMIDGYVSTTYLKKVND